MELYFLIGFLGLISGFLSGLLGIGGGIVLAPLLLYVPPFFGFEPFTMKMVAGLTIVQSFFGCLAGGFIHQKFHFVSAKLTYFMGSSIFITAILGGAGSHYVSDEVLLFIFASLAITAAILMIMPSKHDIEKPEISELNFNGFRAVMAASGVGILGGLVGQGGSFILIPLMTAYVKIPTRIAIGSNLAIIFLASLAAFTGKAITGQIPWLMSIPVILTVIPAALTGGLVSQKIQVKGLRMILAVLIGLAALRMWYSLFW